MKYTIEGFSQVEAIRLGLDVKDLVLLRWIVDFYNTGCMAEHLFEGVPYFWINYQYVIRELPVLGISSKDVLARRMKKMVGKGIIEGRVFESAGHKTYFRFRKDVLRGLLTHTEAQGWLFDSTGGGSDSKVGRVSTHRSEGYRPKSRNHVDSSINDSSIKDKRPTLAEVKVYCEERKSKINPQYFLDYNDTNGWLQGKSKKPIKNWRACIRTWDGLALKDPGSRQIKHDVSGRTAPSAEATDEYLEGLGKDV